MKLRSVISVFMGILLFTELLLPQVFGGDILNESPLTPLPQGMTYEEYVDMNRRISVGLMLAAIPCPGMIHSYAGEAQTAKNIRIKAAIGIGTAVAGMFMLDEGDFPDSDYPVEIVNAGQDNERRYEMIPTGMNGTEVQYTARELTREVTGAGMILIPLGLGYTAWQYIRDYYYGIRIIEDKRSRVRYKYGIKLQPRADLKTGSMGLQLSLAL